MPEKITFPLELVLTPDGFVPECQRQFEIVRKRRRNFVVIRRKGG